MAERNAEGEWVVTKSELFESGLGICIECGSTQEGAEPDARNLLCEDCGKRSVYGIEEALLEGHVVITENFLN
jgi:hypothetical protein